MWATRNCFWVPQGSILEPLSFNEFLADLFFIVDGIQLASYLNDNTPYVSSENRRSHRIFRGIADNLSKSNADKCHLFLNTSDKVNIRIGNIDTCEGQCENSFFSSQFASYFMKIVYKLFIKKIRHHLRSNWKKTISCPFTIEIFGLVPSKYTK